MPRVSRLSYTPVRALGLLHPDHLDLTETGVTNDRRFYLVDERGRLVDRLLAGELVQVAAETNDDATWLRMTFPDGSVVEGDVRSTSRSRPTSTAAWRSATSSAGRGRRRSSRSPIAGCCSSAATSPGGTRIRDRRDPGPQRGEPRLRRLARGSSRAQLGVDDGRRAAVPDADRGRGRRGPRGGHLDRAATSRSARRCSRSPSPTRAARSRPRTRHGRARPRHAPDDPPLPRLPRERPRAARSTSGSSARFARRAGSRSATRSRVLEQAISTSRRRRRRHAAASA